MQHDRKNNDILGKTKTPRNLVFIRNPGILYVCSTIGVTGFEPATSRPPAERATKLRHTPFLVTMVL